MPCRAYEGASQTGWYLFGDPKTIDTWEIGFLKGKRTPTVERGETDLKHYYPQKTYPPANADGYYLYENY